MGPLQLAIILVLAVPALAKVICDSWDCSDDPPTKICDNWDCAPSKPDTGGICDRWDCSPNQPKGGEWKRPPRPFSDVLRLKCENLPFRTYWDRKWLICVDIEPTTQQCKILHSVRGKLGIVGIPADVRNKLESMSMLAEQAPGGRMVNCVWNFGFDCNNGTRLGDRCIEVVGKPDTYPNGGNDCRKKGFSMYVPHNDNDIQLLLVYLMDSVYPDPAYWIGVSNPSTTWNFEDNTVVDFYRWKDGRVFNNAAQAGQFVSKPTDNSYKGYIDVQPTTARAPYICSRDAATDYYTPPAPTGGGGSSSGGSGSSTGVINDFWDTPSDTKVVKDFWDSDELSWDRPSRGRG